MNNKIQELVWDLVSNSLEDSILKLVRSRVEYSVRNHIYISVQNLIHFSVCHSIRSKYE
jgi:hypothetical protein